MEACFKKDLTKIIHFIEEKRNDGKPIVVNKSSSNRRVNLPTYEIERFNGDPTKW